MSEKCEFYGTNRCIFTCDKKSCQPAPVSAGYSEGAGGFSGCTHEDGNGYCNHPMGVHVECKDASAMDVDTLDVDIMCMKAL